MNLLIFLTLSLPLFVLNTLVSCSRFQSGGESKDCAQSSFEAVGRKRVTEGDPTFDSDSDSSGVYSDDNDPTDYGYDPDSYDPDLPEMNESVGIHEVIFASKGVQFLKPEYNRIRARMFGNLDLFFNSLMISQSNPEFSGISGGFGAEEFQLNSAFVEMSTLKTKAMDFLDSLHKENENIIFLIELDNDIFNKAYAEVEEMRAMAQKSFDSMSVVSVELEVFSSWEASFLELARLKGLITEMAEDLRQYCDRVKIGYEEIESSAEKSALSERAHQDILLKFHELFGIIISQGSILANLLQCDPTEGLLVASRTYFADLEGNSVAGTGADNQTGDF